MKSFIPYHFMSMKFIVLGKRNSQGKVQNTKENRA